MSDTTMIPLPYIPPPRQSWTHSRKKNRGGKIGRKRLREVERFRFVVGYIRAIHVNITYITQSRRRLIISIYRFISIIHISIYIYLNRREKRRVSRVTFVTDFFLTGIIESDSKQSPRVSVRVYISHVYISYVLRPQFSLSGEL